MTYEQIIALTERGFTPAQVMQLAGVRDSPEPEPVPEAPPADPEPVPEAPPSDPEPAPETPPAENTPGLAELMASVNSMSQQLAALTRANQEANIRNIIREDSPRGETADDILAGIIHPPMNESKGGTKE